MTAVTAVTDHSAGCHSGSWSFRSSVWIWRLCGSLAKDPRVPWEEREAERAPVTVSEGARVSCRIRPTFYGKQGEQTVLRT